MLRLGRPDRDLQNAKHPPQAGNGCLGLVDDLGELGDRFEEPVGQEDEADQRACGQAAGWAAQQADGHHRTHRQHAEDLARWKQECTDGAGTDERVRAAMTGLLGDRRVVVAGVVRAQRLGAGHHLADRSQDIGVVHTRALVRLHQMALHLVQHEAQRCRHSERHQRQHPVVRQHDAGHHEHQRAVQQPGQRTPREELRQRLDVAGDTCHQSAFPFFAVVGDAQPMDVLEQAHAKSVQRFLAAIPKTRNGRPLADRGYCDHDQPDEGQHSDGPDANLIWVEAAVDGLLHQDGHRDAAQRTHHGQRQGEPDAGLQRGRFLHPAANGLDRRPAAHRLAHPPPPGKAPMPS